MQYPMPNPRRSGGFSLIEAMLSVAVVAFGMTALYKFQAGIVSVGGLNKSRSAAMSLAQEKLEQMRNYINSSDYDALAVLSTPDFVADPDYTNGQITNTNTIFTRSYKIENGPSGASKLITSKVAWSDPKQGTQNVVLSSMIAYADPAESVRIYETSSNSSSTPGPQGPNDPLAASSQDPASGGTSGANPSTSSESSSDPDAEPQDDDATSSEEETTYTGRVTGQISAYSGNAAWTVSANYGGSCIPQNGSGSGSYSCSFADLGSSDTPTVTISFTSSKTVCGNASQSVTLTYQQQSAQLNFAHASNSNQCGN